MGMSMFQVKKGINLDGLTQVMSGAGAPGAAGDASLAPVGSLYLDATNGQLYVKKNTGVGTDKWLRSQNSNDMATAMQGISWREPVKVHDSTAYADLAEATTAMNTGTVDGTAIVANDRILFDNITGANQNVFVVTGTPGSGATLVEDGNALSKGDTLYVNAGTDAGKTFNYNGTIWVQQGGASSTEISFLQAFVGKSADGNELPDYGTPINVANDDSLEVAIGKLDTIIGEQPSGLYLNPSSVAAALASLNATLELERTVAAAQPDAATPTVIDTVAGAVDTAAAFAWDVVVQDTGDNTKAELYRVTTLNNGVDVDYNVASILAVGGGVPGIALSVSIDGGNMTLSVSATGSTLVTATRKGICIGP